MMNLEGHRKTCHRVLYSFYSFSTTSSSSGEQCLSPRSNQEQKQQHQQDSDKEMDGGKFFHSLWSDLQIILSKSDLNRRSIFIILLPWRFLLSSTPAAGGLADWMAARASEGVYNWEFFSVASSWTSAFNASSFCCCCFSTSSSSASFPLFSSFLPPYCVSRGS